MLSGAYRGGGLLLLPRYALFQNGEAAERVAIKMARTPTGDRGESGNREVGRNGGQR